VDMTPGKTMAGSDPTAGAVKLAAAELSGLSLTDEAVAQLQVALVPMLDMIRLVRQTEVGEIEPASLRIEEWDE